MSAPEESKDITEAAPAEKIEIDEVNSADLQKNYDFWFYFFYFCLLIVILWCKFLIFSMKKHCHAEKGNFNLVYLFLRRSDKTDYLFVFILIFSWNQFYYEIFFSVKSSWKFIASIFSRMERKIHQRWFQYMSKPQRTRKLLPLEKSAVLKM